MSAKAADLTPPPPSVSVTVTEKRHAPPGRESGVEEARDLGLEYRTLFQQAADPIFLLNLDGSYRDFNEAAIRLYEYSAEELSKMSFSALVAPEFLEDSRAKLAGLLAGKIFEPYEKVFLTKSGRRIPTEVNVSVIYDAEGKAKCVLSILRDISERKQAERRLRELEQQLLQSQKMESLGRFAGGVAHDFNNILTGILGYAELLKSRHQDFSAQDREAVEVILKGAERAASLTRQLLGFARKGKFNPIPLNVNQNVAETLKICDKLFEKKIRVRARLARRINLIEADGNQIDQALTNMFINAKDAMPDGGELVVTTGNVFLDAEAASGYPQLQAGGYVKISITDTGIGMTNEVSSRIFEPFFTTKAQDQGTGLGLATVYGIVHNHNGEITVKSTPGTGTTFEVLLPVTERRAPRKEAPAGTVPGSATILVVDDEEPVRMSTEAQLKRLGYQVVVAGNGVAAVELVRTKKPEIELVLLDLIMPELDGRETFFRLRDLEPELRVMLISGYSPDGRAAELLDHGAVGFLQKPFRLTDLSAAVENALRQ